MGENLREDELFDGMKIKQFSDGFAYGTDAVLLSAFASPRRGTRGFELGTGTGIIPILLNRHKGPIDLTALEIQSQYAELARDNIEHFGYSDNIRVICGDLCDNALLKSLGEGDYVISNPPYMKSDSGYLNESEKKLIARHEIHCNIGDVCRAAARLLHDGGDFYIIYRPDRLPDLICALRASRLEPKILLPVAPAENKAPSLVLLRARKNSGAEMKMLPVLITGSGAGDKSEIMNEIYYTGRIDIQ